MLSCWRQLVSALPAQASPPPPRPPLRPLTRNRLRTNTSITPSASRPARRCLPRIASRKSSLRSRGEVITRATPPANWTQVRLLLSRNSSRRTALIRPESSMLQRSRSLASVLISPALARPNRSCRVAVRLLQAPLYRASQQRPAVRRRPLRVRNLRRRRAVRRTRPTLLPRRSQNLLSSRTPGEVDSRARLALTPLPCSC